MGAGKPDTSFWISFNADGKVWVTVLQLLFTWFQDLLFPMSPVQAQITSLRTCCFTSQEAKAPSQPHAIVWNRKEALHIEYIGRIHEWIVIIRLTKCHSRACIG